MRSVSEDRVEAADTEAASSEDAEAASKERLLRRKHSRASSVDRREIFQKYISTGSEHAATVALYTGPDTANSNNNILNSITATADTAANTGNTPNRSVIYSLDYFLTSANIFASMPTYFPAPSSCAW